MNNTDTNNEEKIPKKRGRKPLPSTLLKRKLIEEEKEKESSIGEYINTDENLCKLSKARMNALLSKDVNPNQFYYRWNDPGVVPATGEWSKEERINFYNAILELGITYEWGNFSRKILGRVGYQCSNYYRKLITDGDIIDSYYTIIDGKLKFTRNDDLHYVILSSKEKYIKKLLSNNIIIILPDITDPITNKFILSPYILSDGSCMTLDSWKEYFKRKKDV